MKWTSKCCNQEISVPVFQLRYGGLDYIKIRCTHCGEIAYYSLVRAKQHTEEITRR